MYPRLGSWWLWRGDPGAIVTQLLKALVTYHTKKNCSVIKQPHHQNTHHNLPQIPPHKKPTHHHNESILVRQLARTSSSQTLLPPPSNSLTSPPGRPTPTPRLRPRCNTRKTLRARNPPLQLPNRRPCRQTRRRAPLQKPRCHHNLSNNPPGLRRKSEELLPRTLTRG